MTWKHLLSSVFSSPTKCKLGTHAKRSLLITAFGKIAITFPPELMDKLAFPEEHDMFLMLDSFLLKEK
jgi:hypothetical protein